MDDDDLDLYRELSGIGVSLIPLSLALAAWYLPRWWRGFFTTYRRRDPGRLRSWNRWTGVAALLLGLAMTIAFTVKLERAEGEMLLSARFFLALVQGSAGALLVSGPVVVLLMAVRKVVMLVRRATPYDRQEVLTLAGARRTAQREINTLDARLADAASGEPGRQRAWEYLELARRLLASSHPRQRRGVDPEWDELFARGAVEAVIAAALCQVARSALEKGEPVAEEKTLCLFDPLHGPSDGTHEMALLERDAAAYPLCHACLLHVRTVPEREWKGRMLALDAWGRVELRMPFLGVAVALMDGDTRPAHFVELAVAVLDSEDQDSQRAS